MTSDDPIESWLKCQMCSNGLRTFSIRTDTSEIFLECDECLSGYMAISTKGLNGHFWTDLTAWESRLTSHSEVLTAGLGWAIDTDSCPRRPSDAHP